MLLVCILCVCMLCVCVLCVCLCVYKLVELILFSSRYEF